ncbi:MAG: hypothetical protein ACRDT0_15580 [Pseudonocardiaceae bacterium]
MQQSEREEDAAKRGEASVTASGFADRAPATDDLLVSNGLHCSATLDGTVRTVVELSGRDMNGSEFLLGSAFTAVAFSEPALYAITVPPAENTETRTPSPDDPDRL